MYLPLHTRMDAAEGLRVFLRLAARLKGNNVSRSGSIAVAGKESHPSSQQSSDLSRGPAREDPN